MLYASQDANHDPVFLFVEVPASSKSCRRRAMEDTEHLVQDLGAEVPTLRASQTSLTVVLRAVCFFKPSTNKACIQHA